LHNFKNLTFKVQKSYTVVIRVGSRHKELFVRMLRDPTNFFVIICAQELPVLITFITLQRNGRKL